MNISLITVGIIMIILGLIGVMSSYMVTWMWVILALGIVIIIWGWMSKDKEKMM